MTGREGIFSPLLEVTTSGEISRSTRLSSNKLLCCGEMLG